MFFLPMLWKLYISLHYDSHLLVVFIFQIDISMEKYSSQYIDLICENNMIDIHQVSSWWLFCLFSVWFNFFLLLWGKTSYSVQAPEKEMPLPPISHEYRTALHVRMGWHLQVFDVKAASWISPEQGALSHHWTSDNNEHPLCKVKMQSQWVNMHGRTWI